MRRLTLPIVAVLLAVACSGGGDDEPEVIGREGSVVVEDADDVAIGAPVGSYQVTYRIEETDGDDVVARDATLTVVRPFQSRFELGDLLRVADFGYFGEDEPGDETEVVTAVPAPSPGDVRADVVDLGEGFEVREIAGRRCQVHHFGASLLDGLYVEGDSVESCVDGDGLVLEEVTTVDGRIILRRVATAVELEPDVEVAFELEGIRPRSADDGGGSIQEVEPTSASPGVFYEVGAVPDGFELLGRYAVVPPQTARLDDEQTRSRYVAGVVDVWTRGIDVLVLDQGGTLGQVPPFGADPNGEAVTDVGEIASIGEVVRHPNGAEVRILIPPGRYVKVSGTLTVDELLDITRSLRATEGTGLVYVEEG